MSGGRAISFAVLAAAAVGLVAPRVATATAAPTPTPTSTSLPASTSSEPDPEPDAGPAPRAGLLFIAAGIILLFLVLRRAQRRNARAARDAARPRRRFPGRP